jgi:hypothetical protein
MRGFFGRRGARVAEVTRAFCFFPVESHRTSD